MNSLFTRTYLILVVLMLVGFILTLILTDNFLESTDGKYFQRDAEIEAQLLERKLLLLTPDTWSKFIANYHPLFETSISLLEEHEVVNSEFVTYASPDKDTLFTGQSFEPWWLLHPLPDDTRYLLVEENEAPMTRDDWLSILLPLTMIALIVACALWYIARYMARPIHALSTVAQTLGERQLEARADENTLEPVRGLARSFNRMADDMQRLIGDQTVVIGALPHELRTPISRARFALDMTRSIQNIDTLHEQIEKVDGYVEELESIVEDTLKLSRLQSGKKLQVSSFSLEELISNLCEQRIDDKTIQLTWQCCVRGAVLGDPGLLRLAIGNLIDNALKYGHSAAQVTCRQLSDRSIVITVDDDGEGIPESQRETIFKPFYRVDSSRSRKTGGIGLGLAIVELIARQMKASVTVAPCALGGTRILFNWPQP